MAKSTSPLPRALASGARRFDLWREARTTRRIPAKLWSLATDLGIRFGVSCTARALGVDYYALKKRIDAAAARGTGAAAASPAFVEILTEPSIASSECVVEFENVGGSKMRIELKGASTPDLAELTRVFLDPRT